MEIVHEMIARATPEAVYRALTESPGLASWFAPEIHAQPQVGSAAEFWFDSGARSIKAEIVELEPNRKVVWKVLQGLSGWDDVLGIITWRLTPVEWGTKVHFTHSGWSNTEGAFPSVNFKWAWFISRMKAYAETGMVTPMS
jgi:uncharacterized protein YndB with AHSA1/START domain